MCTNQFATIFPMRSINIHSIYVCSYIAHIHNIYVYSNIISVVGIHTYKRMYVRMCMCGHVSPSMLLFKILAYISAQKTGSLHTSTCVHTSCWSQRNVHLSIKCICIYAYTYYGYIHAHIYVQILKPADLERNKPLWYNNATREVDVAYMCAYVYKLCI